MPNIFTLVPVLGRFLPILPAARRRSNAVFAGSAEVFESKVLLAGTGIVIQDDFETGSPSTGWDSVFSVDNSDGVVSGIAKSGQHSYRIRYSPPDVPGEEDEGKLEKYNALTGDEFYVRYWQMYPTGFDQQNLKQSLVFNVEEGHEGEVLVLVIWGAGFQGENTELSTISYADDRNEAVEFSIPPGEWFRTAYYCKMNTPGQSNGIYKLWRNDQLILDLNDVQFRTTAKNPDSFWIGGNYSGTSLTPFDRYIDDIFVATTPSVDPENVKPEIQVLNGTTNIPDNGTLAFGAVLKGATGLTKTITIKNTGTGNLVLQPATLPANSGYTIVTNITPNKILAPNATTTLVVRLDSVVPGSKLAKLSFGNTDADEGPFDINLSGTVSAPEIQVLNGTTNIPDNGTLAFGAVLKGATGLTKTITIKNTGTGNLALQPATLPANSGYTIVTNITPNKVLAPSATTTLVVRLDSVVPGSKLAKLSFGNTDADEGPFDINLSGTVSAPEIQVLNGTTNIPDNGTLAFGAVLKGATGLTKTITIKNTGTGNLVLQPATLPANSGYTIVTNITPNKILAPNATTTLVVRLDSIIVGAKRAKLSFGNTDADEGPFDINLSGIVSAL